MREALEQNGRNLTARKPFLKLFLGGCFLVDAYRDISVLDYGADRTGDRLCTEAFKRAISDIERAGGGILRVPSGDYFTGPISLTSNFILWLAHGATLRSDTDRTRLPLIRAIPAYGPDVSTVPSEMKKPQADLRDAIPRVPPMLHGVGLHNVTITGENGRLDGQGSYWWLRWLDEPLDGRPHLVQFERSTNIRMFNVTLLNPGFWAVHLWLCKHVHVRYVSVLVVPWDPPIRPTNTDGVNPDSSQHVLIEDSYFQTGDDAIAIKSGWDCFGRQVNVPSKNITIRRVKVKQTKGCNAAGIAVGSEMSGGVEDVFIENSSFVNTGAAVEVKVGAGRGGYVRNIHAKDLSIGQTARGAIVVMATYPEPNPFCREENPPMPTVHNISFQRVTVQGPTRGNLVQLQGTKEVNLHNVSVHDVTTTHQGWGMWSCARVSGTGHRNNPPACAALRGAREYSSRYEDHGSQQTPVIKAQGSARASGAGRKWRNDGRCGFDFRGDEGQPGTCPTAGEFAREENDRSRMFAEQWLRNAPCCSLSGWCGSEEEHCTCYGCMDFRQQESQTAAYVATRQRESDWAKSYQESRQQKQQESWWSARESDRSWRQEDHSRPRETARPSPKPKRPARINAAAEIAKADDRDQVQHVDHWETQEDSNADSEDAEVDSYEDQEDIAVGEYDDELTERALSLANTVSDPPVRGLITSLVFALCVFLCGLLVRRYLTVARKHCFCLGGLACLAVTPYFGILFQHALDPGILIAETHPRSHQHLRRIGRDKRAQFTRKARAAARRKSFQIPAPAANTSHGAHQASTASSSSAVSIAVNNTCGTRVTPLDFGAIGDGRADDTEAVRKCLQHSHRCRNTDIVIGPAGRVFQVRPGELKVQLRNLVLKFEGELLGPSLRQWNPQHDVWPAGSCAYGESGCEVGKGQSPEFVRSQWTLLHLSESSNVTIEGPGGLRAPGRSFWVVRNRRPEVRGYCLLKLEQNTGVRIRSLQLTDSPMYQVVIMNSNNVDMHGLSIVVNDLTVGEGGPHNTDGVSIIASQNISLRNSEVESGDDNVVIKEGSRGIVVDGVLLFRGKGVSIGSLGERSAEDQVVKDILFRNVSLDYSMHGARIKTWIGSRGLVKNITFESFKMHNVAFGILIDQNYCPLSQRPEGCGKADEVEDAISIEDVRFRSFHGTFMRDSKKVACVRCKRVTVRDIKLQRSEDVPKPQDTQEAFYQRLLSR